MQTPLAFQANIFAPQQKGSGLCQNVTRGHFGSTLVRFKVSGLACLKKHWHHGKDAKFQCLVALNMIMICFSWCYYANIPFPNTQDKLQRFSRTVQTTLLAHVSSYSALMSLYRIWNEGYYSVICYSEQLGNHSSTLNINTAWRSHAEGMCCHWCESWRLWCLWEGSGTGQGVRGNIDCVEPPAGPLRTKTQNQFFMLVLWASGYKSTVTLKSKNKQWKLVSRALW